MDKSKHMKKKNMFVLNYLFDGKKYHNSFILETRDIK
jgi:hypothetical protein